MLEFLYCHSSYGKYFFFWFSFFISKSYLLLGCDAMYNRTSAYIFLCHFYGWNFRNAFIDFTHYLVRACMRIMSTVSV